MVKLADAYRAARGDDGGDTAALENVLQTLVERGRTAHPELALTAEMFAAHLARCGAAVTNPDTLRAEDLYLACAGLAGEPAAVKKVKENCGPMLAKYLTSIDAAAAFLAEVEQQVWEALFIGSDGEPKIKAYSGRGPLGGFVGVIGQRMAITDLRRQSAQARAEAEIASLGPPVERDPELAFVKKKYQQDFHDAIRDALATLTSRDRLIYRLHVVDNVSVDGIAVLYRVSQSTVSRWLAKSRQNVLTEVRRLLRERLRLSDADLQSLLGHMLSQLDISASQILSELPAASG